MKKLWILMFAVLLISVAAAEMEFDNIGSYDDKTKTMTVEDNFGLGGDLAKITLNSPLEVFVIRGEDRLVAEFTIENIDDYDNVFNKMDFYQNSLEFTRDFQYKYKTSRIETRTEYDLVCDDYIEYTNCVKENVKEVEYKVYEWLPLNEKAILIKGNITVGIFTDVYPGESVEWIPTFYGVEIDEWAVWTEALNVNITSYHTFNETSGTNAFDIVNESYNFTTFETPTWNDSGLIGYALQFDGTSEYALMENNFTFYPNYTLNFWLKLDAIDGADNQKPFGRYDSGGAGEISYTILLGTSDLRPRFTQSNTTGVDFSDQTINVGDWAMLTMIVNQTHYRSYLNGTHQQTIGYDGTTYALAVNTSIGGRSSGVDDWLEGLIDEMGIWNRTLTDAEITQLFNGGSGISYDSTPTEIDMSVVLIAPVNNTNTTSTTSQFQTELSITNGNLTNTTLTIWNPNNTIFKTNTTTFPSGTTTNTTNISISGFLIESGYQWNFFTCGDNSTGFVECKFADTNRTINILPYEIDSETFTAEVLETSSQTIEINITTIPAVLSVDAFLNYNGTRNLATTTCVGQSCSITETIDIPLVATTNWENKSFSWEITVFDGTSSSTIDTPAKEQNVSKIFLEVCDATYDVQTLNFTTYDEQHLDRISPFYFNGTFDFWIGGGTVKGKSSITDNVTEMNLCLSPNETMSIDATIDYDEASGINYTNRFYYFDEHTINNVSQDIFMYLLNSSFSTSFILKVQDESLLPVEDALIEIHRYYPGEGIFRIVQIARTDDNGKSIGFFQTETVDYKFIIKLDGETLLETTQQKIVPETSPFTLTFNVGDTLEEPWESQQDLEDLDSSLTWNDTSGIVTYTYIDISGNFSLARLLVVKESLVNFSADTTICDTNLSISSGSLTCIVGTTDGFYIASSFITRDSTITLDRQISFQIETLSGVVGLLGLFYGWFLILIASFMFRFNEIAGIWAITITVFLVNLIGLISFGGVFVTAIIAIAILLTWIMEK